MYLFLASSSLNFETLIQESVYDSFVNLNSFATPFKLISEYLKHLLTWSHNIYRTLLSLFSACLTYFISVLYTCSKSAWKFLLAFVVYWPAEPPWKNNFRTGYCIWFLDWSSYLESFWFIGRYYCYIHFRTENGRFKLFLLGRGLSV